VSFDSVEQLKAIIRSSGIHDANGRFVIDRREYLGKTLTFPTNPNPQLFEGEGEETVAGYTLDRYLPMMFRGSRLINGCYVDSLGKWCGYYNSRREHFAYSTVPLTYAGDPPRVCLWSAQSHAEYLWELGKRLHADGKIVLGNGVHPDRVMLGFAVDALGTESLPSYRNPSGFYSRRVAAGNKPYCVLNSRQRDNATLWNSSLFLGFLMGCNTPDAAERERLYLPAMVKLNEAGWEPVTHARARPNVVGVERWGGGPRRRLCFTIMNRSTKPRPARIILDRAALRLPRQIAARDMLTGEAIAASESDAGPVLRLDLAAEQAVAVRVRCVRP